MIDISRENIIKRNKEIAEKWISECPKSHKLKKFMDIVKPYADGKLVIRDGTVFTLFIGNYGSGPHENWQPVELRLCEAWKVDETEQEKHLQEIHELRHNTLHFGVISDIASLRIIVDGTTVLAGGCNSDGDHKVWIVNARKGSDIPNLSLEDTDMYIFTLKAKNLKIMYSDCEGTDDVFSEIVFEDSSEKRTDFDVYSTTNGWKVVKWERN